MEDEIELKLTDDGSHTLYSPRFRQYYHSYFGAWIESIYTCILEGWDKVDPNITVVNVFEMGMGTGLDVLLTFQKAKKENRIVHYFSTEAYPPSDEIIYSLNHAEVSDDPELGIPFAKIHSCEWEKEVPLTDSFFLHKTRTLMQELDLPENHFHLLYYDAFAPGSQPELWTPGIFRKLFSAMQPGGILTTYCAKGEVRRNMQAAGFTVEKIPGPPGKREMLRAIKKSVG